MYKSKKSNTLIIIISLLFIVAFIFSPATYMQSTLNGISVWSNNVLPSLFPFLIVTRILSSNIPHNNGLIGYMDKFTFAAFGSKNGAGYTFLLSILSGYPVGAKLLSYDYDNGRRSANETTKMLSFCSTSGPLFLLGAVGIGILKSYSAGIVLLVSHILGAVCNGVLYRRRHQSPCAPQTTVKKDNINDIMYNSVTSILLVGGFIAISYVLVDMLLGVGAIPWLADTVGGLLRVDSGVIRSILCGAIEMTRGCIELSQSNISLQLKTLLCSGLIAFSGMSIFLQTRCFLPDQKIKSSRILLQKLTQSIFTMIICGVLLKIFSI